MWQEVTDQMAAASGNDAAPVLSVSFEYVSLKWIDLVTNHAGDHCVVLHSFNSPRSGRKHKAWGASPRINIEIESESAKRPTAQGIRRCRPLRGLVPFIYNPILGLAPQALCLRPL